MLTATRVDRYELLSPIGTGGMGRVFRAKMEGPGGASKQVALKVMHAHLVEDQDFVLLFLDEMRVAMALSHRNIVQTFDAGKAGDHYFMAMELIDGCSLSELLARWPPDRRFPLDVALFIGMEVSAALEYAHRFRPEAAQRAGVLHRDVSPANILLSTEGDVKLADFGVAKAAGARHVTSANLIRGKLQYMSPEQANGQAAPRSDLFSLGAVIYEMVTGQPIPRPTAFEGLRHTALPPPARRLRPDLPTALDALILRCLEPDPADRVASAGELRSALAAVAFAQQQQEKQSIDRHARLREVLREQGLATRTAETAAAPAAARLAQAVLDEVRAVQTDPEMAASAAASGQPSLAEAQTVHAGKVSPGDPEIAATALPVREKKRPLSLFALSFAVLGAVAGGWYWWARGNGAAESPSERQGKEVDAALASASNAPDAATGAEGGPEADLPTRQRPPDAAEPERPAKQRRANRRGGYGYLDINAVPWAKVYVDGRFRGETPLQRLRLRARVHTVRLVNPSRGLSSTQRVRVEAGRSISRVFHLSADGRKPGPAGSE